MNTSTYYGHGDAVIINLTEQAYPYERDMDSDGTFLDNLSTQGRVVYADALGLCVREDGGKILPRVGNEYCEMETGTQRFFPWHSVTGITLLLRSAEYEKQWDALDELEKQYALAHDAQWARTNSELLDWATNR